MRTAASKAAARMAARHDQNINFTSYPRGSKVWVRDHTAAVGGKPKLGLPFKVPVTVIDKQGTPGKEVTYKVRDELGRVRIVHHNDLKEYIPRGSDSETTPRSRDQVGLIGSPGEGWRMETRGLRAETEAPLLFLVGSRGSDAGAQNHRGDSAPRPPISYITRSGRVSRPPERYSAGV